MADEPRTPREDEEQAAKEGERPRDEAKQKDRLKDLDVTDPDGGSVKGGKPILPG